MKLCSNVCNRCRLVCVIFFKSEQICSCCCKMLSGSLFWDTRYIHCVTETRHATSGQLIALANVNRFSKFLHWQIPRKLHTCMLVRFPHNTSNVSLHYLVKLENCNVVKFC